HRAPVPGVALIGGMTVRHPSAYVIGQTDVAVVAARHGGQVDGLPTVIVGIRVRPAWVIAGMESPGTIEQGRCGAQRWRIRSAAARQGGDRDGQRHQRRYDDADDQLALGCVDRGHHRRYRFGHQESSLATLSSVSRVRPTRYTVALSRAKAGATAPPID